MPFFSFSSSRRKTAGRKSSRRAPLLPAALHGFLARRLTDTAGGIVAGSGTLLALALFTYDARDPSLNTGAARAAAHNLLGLPGAYTADLLLQTLGLSAWLIVGAFAAWGARILLRKPIERFGGKLPLLLLSVLSLSVAAARVPAPGFWDVAAGLGGSFGRLTFNAATAALQGWIGQMAFLFVALSALMLSVVFYGLCLGFTAAEWRAGAARVSAGLSAAWWWARGVAAALAEWYETHSGEEPARPRRAAASRPRRASLKEDLEPDEDEEDAETEGEAALAAPRRKPVVTPRPEKPKAQPEERQKKLNLRAGGDDEWQLPALDMFAEVPAASAASRLDEAALQKNAEMLHATLGDFGVQGEILKVSPGPIVTLYEMEPAPGTKTSRVVGLADDIARSMSAVSARIAAVPGKNAIGIELPNAKRETVYLKELLASREYDKAQARLPLILGKNIAGDPVIADLARMPHLLVAGTTGSGKSVAVNTMILSLLCRLSPEQCRFIMIDPKMLELSVYDDIPHLLTPVVTEPHRAVVALKWAVREMEDRYRAMSKLGVRNIDGYNERIRAARASGEVLMHRVQTGFDLETGKPVYEEQPISLVDLPYIVIIVDEFADLMLVAGKEVENAIQRLAQMARAAGLHLIMATQRPSVDVITGVIKANFPTRISFQVTSRIDSRTILGDGGAEQLLGQGDMLYMAAGGRIARVHGPFVSDGEVEKVSTFLKRQRAPVYIDGVTEDTEGEGAEGGAAEGGVADELYDQAVAIVIRERKASTSFIQRHLQIGYNRAARIIERMEREGLVTSANAVGKREILGGGGNYGT